MRGEPIAATTALDAAAHRFSTAALPEEQRVERWEQHNFSELFDLRCRTLGAALDASMVDVALDRVRLARVAGTPHVVERTAELVRHRPADALVAYLTLAGEAFFHHEDAVRTLRPGQLLVCDTDRPFLRGFSRGLEELVVKVPRQAFRDLTGLDALRTPVVAEFGPREGRLEARTLARLVGGAVRPREARPVEEHTVLQLLGRVLTPGAPADLGAVHLATAQAFICEHLGDPGLTASRVAEAVGLSERHLSRVFAASGTSVPQYVLVQRLDRARTMLLDHPEIGVAEVAARSGFGSASYFSRAFRDRFGRRASDVRREARAARG
ncbi:helix-turn-helix domain-containing protein [Nocardioides sp. DS6]|uniref:Helix-turn-helix domain-containing protein n=1 Tax=Nocardioides eburneus TaxID=3231482 RepID=A0ABV3T031_9ACTN